MRKVKNETNYHNEKNNEMKIYEALYNEMIHESSYATISIHKTKQGARNALAKYIWKERKKHYSIYKSHGGTIPDDEPPYIFGQFEAWDVAETTLLD